MKARTTILVATLLLGLLAVSVEGYPSGRSHRQKRLSDQRLAELQTKLALAQILRKHPHAAHIMPSFADHLNNIGRKKRSQLIYEEIAEALQDSLDDVDDMDYYDAEAESKQVPQQRSETRRHVRTRMSPYQ